MLSYGYFRKMNNNFILYIKLNKLKSPSLISKVSIHLHNQNHFICFLLNKFKLAIIWKLIFSFKFVNNNNQIWYFSSILFNIIGTIQKSVMLVYISPSINISFCHHHSMRYRDFCDLKK